jgi:hypothetical protein
LEEPSGDFPPCTIVEEATSESSSTLAIKIKTKMLLFRFVPPFHR